MNKDTLAREIGNYFLNYCLVPRTKKNFIDKGRKHFNGYSIRRYRKNHAYRLNGDTILRHSSGEALMRRPENFAEFLYYYSDRGVRVPRRDKHGKILRDANNRMLHKTLKSPMPNNALLLKTAFSSITNSLEHYLKNTDNFPNNE